jgi:hypothetical protein
MEYPRLGLIRIEAFDHFVKDATINALTAAAKQPHLSRRRI